MEYLEKPENTGVSAPGIPSGAPEGAGEYPDTPAQPEEPSPEEDPHAKRPPFVPSNLERLKFGGRSPRVYGAVAEAISEALVESEPHLAAFPEELAAISSMEAVAALLRIEIAANGIRDKATGNLRAALIDRYFTAERNAAKRRDALGLSPIGEAVLARERAATAALTSSAAVDLSTLAARGRESREARGDIVVTVLDRERRAYAKEREIAAAEWRAEQKHDSDEHQEGTE